MKAPRRADTCNVAVDPEKRSPRADRLKVRVETLTHAPQTAHRRRSARGGWEWFKRGEESSASI
jgi:hypothetical protein